ncbi:kidney mitochondrial carrier protein 1-like isoform X5 [Phyllopteryx taeniolatus]|uniref:kidney mitochondrial carrier protein 1-like isoform X5 n=1 Tax=Phyllopteryx taeniolatus TaxID=161469 RepID=UPI002AD2958A|nr:kidney mitochondrial carrier protein 1-like isoform X5 [Phyllopteryx taeniolatus]
MSSVSWKPFVFGGLASVTAECGTFPIDLAKTRLQVQGQVGDSKYREIRYRGMLHAIVRIAREEGVRALYSGIAPATLRQASYGTIKIGTYQSLKRLLAERPQDETLATNVLCGVLAGVVSSSIANPTDVLKIRMQAQGRVIRGSMMGNFISIYQQEGTRGLWKVQLRVRPGGGAGLQPGGRGPDADDESERSGFVPGNARLRAAGPSVPARQRDKRNTRRFSACTKSPNVSLGYLPQIRLHLLAKTWRSEGLVALYKGFFPNWLRLGPWNIIFFLTYEQLKKINV